MIRDLARRDLARLKKLLGRANDSPYDLVRVAEEKCFGEGYEGQAHARVYGDFYHARGPAAELRDQMLGSRTPEDAYEGMAWLYAAG